MQKKQATSSPKPYSPRLKEKYYKEIVPSMMQQLGYTSPMQVPRLRAIHINQGYGKIKTNTKAIETLLHELGLIAGQKAVPTKAKKAIANFKLREGTIVGGRVTLRGNRMYEFLDRLVAIHLLRIRDFRGVSDKLDGHGNYTIGIKEQLIFTEINIDKVDIITGMNITIETSAKKDDLGRLLLKEFGMPFKTPKK